MKIAPFTEVNEDVGKAADWLSDLGFNFLQTRIGAYRKKSVYWLTFTERAIMGQIPADFGHFIKLKKNVKMLLTDSIF